MKALTREAPNKGQHRTAYDIKARDLGERTG